MKTLQDIYVKLKAKNHKGAIKHLIESGHELEAWQTILYNMNYYRANAIGRDRIQQQHLDDNDPLELSVVEVEALAKNTAKWWYQENKLFLEYKTKNGRPYGKYIMYNGDGTLCRKYVSIINKRCGELLCFGFKQWNKNK